MEARLTTLFVIGNDGASTVAPLDGTSVGGGGTVWARTESGAKKTLTPKTAQSAAAMRARWYFKLSPFTSWSLAQLSHAAD
jgi:hypothetical protein